MNEEQSKYIVRVLTFQCNPSTATDDIQQDLFLIRNRYSELKQSRSYEDASILAKAEWLQNYINQTKKPTEQWTKNHTH